MPGFLWDLVREDTTRASGFRYWGEGLQGSGLWDLLSLDGAFVYGGKRVFRHFSILEVRAQGLKGSWFKASGCQIQ